MTPDEIAQLRALEQAATPGPWSYSDVASIGGGMVYDEKQALLQIEWDNYEAKTEPIRRPVFASEADRNGELIAATRNALPGLLDAAEEAERLRAELEELKAAVVELTPASPLAEPGDFVRVETAEKYRAELDALRGRLAGLADEHRNRAALYDQHNDYRAAGERATERKIRDLLENK